MIVRIISALVMFLAAPAYAQQTITQYIPFSGYEKPLSIVMTPDQPGPGDQVHLSLQSAALDLDRSTIVWSSNGTVIAHGDGVKEIDIIAGGLGSDTAITATVTNDTASGSALVHIHPMQMDLIWNADSYVPPFYKGRTLPGTNASIRVYALVHLQNQTSPEIPESNIVYTWYRNGALVLSGRGKSSTVFPGPPLFGTDTISVTAESLDKTLIARAEIRLPAVDSSVSLYENSPLFGILYHRAIQGDVNSNETQEKVTAVPYFAHITSPRDPALTYLWHVNDANIQSDPNEPQTLTITANNYTGPAAIDLTLTSADDIVMRASGLWRLIFGQNANVFKAQSSIFGH